MTIKAQIDPEQMSFSTPPQPHRLPLAEPCPKCGAVRGEPCQTESGELATREHKARRRLAAFLPIGGSRMPPLSDQSSGASREPHSVVEYAADTAFKAAEAFLRGMGAELTTMIVLVHAANVPEGELDCVSAGHGYDDGAELLADIFSHFSGAAKELGIEIKLAPLGRG